MQILYGEVQMSYSCFSLVSVIFYLSVSCIDNEIVCFLKVQLAEAINLQDKNQMAQIQETMRCVSRLDPRTCRKLLTAIAEDYRYTNCQICQVNGVYRNGTVCTNTVRFIKTNVHLFIHEIIQSCNSSHAILQKIM